MASPLRYPATPYLPEPLLDFNPIEERRRLSPSSLIMFFNLMKLWNVPDESARLLLGGVSNRLFCQLQRNPKRSVLNVDQMFRVSYLLGIFKSLNILHAQKLADEWVTIPNRSALFGGTTPLDYMIAGGLPAMQNVRRLLDGRRGGE